MTDIRISGYSAQPQSISLGTRGSVGVETLAIHTDATWDGLDRQAIFLAGSSEALGVAVPASGELPVPAAATRTAGWHSLVITGISRGKVIYSCAISAYVQPQPADLADLETPMPDLISQYVAETREDRLLAEAAAGKAQNSAEAALEASGRYPIIQDGAWWVWSPDKGQYVDTGQAAGGGGGPGGDPITAEEIERVLT